jgi:hypothetical protein
VTSRALGSLYLGRAQRHWSDEPVGIVRAVPRCGSSLMNGKKRLSLWAACLQVGGYPELLLNLARQHGLEIHEKGRARYVNRDDLDRLGRHVREWLDRPRMSRAAGLTGRAGPHGCNSIARSVEAVTDRVLPGDVED